MLRNWPFPGIIPGSASVIYADPPWHFENYSRLGEGRGAARHYPTMTLDDLKALPVGEIAAPDCALFVWIVKAMVPEALDLIRAWDFTFKTIAFTWVKTRPSGREFMNNGFWTRGNPELVFLATRGAPRRRSRGVRELVEDPCDWFEGGPDAIYAHAREHSRKPDEVRARIEALMEPGPPGRDARVELFARAPAPGWQAFGNQTDRFVPPTNESRNGR